MTETGTQPVAETAAAGRIMIRGLRVGMAAGAVAGGALGSLLGAFLGLVAGLIAGGAIGAPVGMLAAATLSPIARLLTTYPRTAVAGLVAGALWGVLTVLVTVHDVSVTTYVVFAGYCGLVGAATADYCVRTP